MSQSSRTAKDIFMAAIETESTERTAFLEAACAGDSVLRRQVEALLRVHDEPDSLLDRPRIDLEMPADGVPGPNRNGEQLAIEQPGDSIGPFKLLQQIGEGGMGVVFMAEQTEPLQRTVALKIIKPGMDTRQVIARFEAERQALAVMDHHNIAKVLDAGTTDAGRPYFVMELVKGVPITTYCDEKQLSLRQRLELFNPVCHAVQHAHQKGIIHRDLKPSNVLVAEYDGKPVPKVIDFGVAKATAQRLTERTMFTQYGQIVGTFEYMSPEQARFNQLDVDTRSDIYSLGVLLYELLAGSTPLEKERLRSAAFDEILRIISEEDPPRPSTRLSSLSLLRKRAGSLGTRRGEVRVSSPPLPPGEGRGEGALDSATIAANRQTDPAKLTKELSGELDWIVMKCVEKDRNRRYETATGLGRDIDRYLQDEPVEACPPSAAYRFRKFARRNKAALLTMALVSAALVLGTVVSTWQAIRAYRAEEGARANEREALANAEQAAAVSDFLVKAFQSPDPARDGRTVTIAEVLQRAADKLKGDLAKDPLIQASLLSAIGQSYSGLGLYHESIPLLEQNLRLLKLHYGPTHEATLVSTNHLAEAYQNVGQLAEALRMFEQSLLLCKENLGATHAVTLSNMNLLANAYLAAGRLPEAVSLHEETLRARTEHLGPTHIDTLASMQNLAAAYSEAGQRAKAIPLLENARKVYKDQFGPTYPDTLESVKSVAIAYRHIGRLEEAVQLLEETVRLQKEKLGPTHSDTLLSMDALALAYSDDDRNAEAVPLLEEALRILKDQFGPSHHDTLMSMNNLAIVYKRSGRFKEAISLYEKAFGISKEQLGATHPHTLASMNNLAIAYGNAGRLAEALPLLEEVLKLLKEKLGPTHPHTLMTMVSLSSNYREAGRYPENVRLCEEGLRVRQEQFGPTHPHTIDATIRLAHAYWLDDQIEKAIETCDEGLKLAPDDYGLHISLAKILCSRTAANNQRLQRAVKVATTATEIDPQNFEAWRVLGWARYGSGDWNGTIEAIQKSMSLDPNDEGGNSFDWFFLAMAHAQLGHRDEAHKWYNDAEKWMDENMPDDIDLLCIRAEAAPLLGIAEPKSSAEPQPRPTR